MNICFPGVCTKINHVSYMYLILFHECVCVGGGHKAKQTDEDEGHLTCLPRIKIAFN